MLYQSARLYLHQLIFSVGLVLWISVTSPFLGIQAALVLVHQSGHSIHSMNRCHNSRYSPLSNTFFRMHRRIFSSLDDDSVVMHPAAPSQDLLLNSTTATTTTTPPLVPTRVLNAKEAARAKRKKLLGVAKAVDRGLPHIVAYAPAKQRTILEGESSSDTSGSTSGDGHSDPLVTFQAWSGLPDRSRPFTVLGIESSCDDTGAAVVRSDGVILGEALAKQHSIHEAWGGVVPGLARDAHVAAMDGVVEQALHRAGLTSVAQVDAIAVTVGPGLEICLRVGCEKAVQLAQDFDKPFVGVHHLEAHILMARLPLQSNSMTSEESNVSPGLPIGASNEAPAQQQSQPRPIEFPFLALLVSGGHCQLMQCNGIGQYCILGGTLDDSLGEAYDKTARLLGLPIGGGGGPAIEKLALHGNPRAIALSVPMQTRKDCDFSYAGLKTNVRRAAEKLVQERNLQRLESDIFESVDQLPEQDKADIAASFQNVAIRHIEDRLKRAMDCLEESSSIHTLAVVGGVAANLELRSRLQAVCAARSRPWTMVVPPPRLCTDQGAYVNLFVCSICITRVFLESLTIRTHCRNEF